MPPPVDGVEVSLNEDNFQSEVLQSPQLVLVEFGATWCGPCRDMESVLAHLSLDYEGRVKVGKVDVDESERLAAEYEASGIPLMVLIKDGVEVDRTVGWHSLDELSNWVDGYL
ncbi:MAG: thiol reductase thioredoxin [Planctomycetota bacterium]|nr:MAG: thiol reductase thioredoxin [Planctomycetota bacterium]REK26571.1 MAG: thiol reductase thioredoxin [Planctomycetota bacterium]REK34093.1 MAG: thiol reductase thioredoxin [Planctomycetota bacterium]